MNERLEEIEERLKALELARQKFHSNDLEAAFDLGVASNRVKNNAAEDIRYLLSLVEQLQRRIAELEAGPFAGIPYPPEGKKEISLTKDQDGKLIGVDVHLHYTSGVFEVTPPVGLPYYMPNPAWRCVCGQINSVDEVTCSRCGMEQD